MLEKINESFFGPFLPIVLLVAGFFLCIRLRFSIFMHPIKIIKALFKKQSGNASPFKAACVALAGTLGVGNIAGVAAAITAGGAGAVFWMWISALLAMVIKYAEVVTAMYFRKTARKEHGSAALYIEKGIGSKILACSFAVIIIVSSLSIGNIVQSSAAAQSLSESFSVPKIVTGIIFAVLTLALIRGGFQRVAKFSSLVIPVLSLGYILISMAIIISNAEALPSILREIVSDAFKPSAAVGGGIGFLINKAMRFGAARGILSNEAGCGTAASAHASSDCKSEVEQGFWGIFEVFVDTIILCTMTAFVVIIYFGSGGPYDGMELAIKSYEAAGEWAGKFIAVSASIYALASVICWSYYGTENLAYLGASKRIQAIYTILYSITGIAGAVFAPSFVWQLADCSISLMAIVNTIFLCLLARIPAKLTRDYFG